MPILLNIAKLKKNNFINIVLQVTKLLKKFKQFCVKWLKYFPKKTKAIARKIVVNFLKNC